MTDDTTSTSSDTTTGDAMTMAVQGKSRDTTVTTVTTSVATMINQPGPDAIAAALAAGWPSAPAAAGVPPVAGGYLDADW